MKSGPTGSVSDDEDDLFLPHPNPPSSSSPCSLVHLAAADLTPQLKNVTITNEEESYFTNARMYRPSPPSSAEKENILETLGSNSNSQSAAQVQRHSKERVARQGSIVDGLLHEIYDRWHYGRSDSIDSDTLTECSSTSDFVFLSRHESGGYHSAVEKRHAGQLNKSFYNALNML